MTNIVKYMSARSSRDHANRPSQRANDSVAKEKRKLRRTLRRKLKATSETGSLLVMGNYWT